MVVDVPTRWQLSPLLQVIFRDHVLDAEVVVEILSRSAAIYMYI